ncbi:inter-alpha-trypsin inhibitor heavy chain-related [Striga hermonthica]|uniref:Inter-alpha-trypsin inhibitor heavy chain-related n=1 Tax=Striga hermonthica TaxID=68872 RepID=A0A9N7N196_STRHE|nr:inter-alpha-trypsin inhibitor heavy chain-related [Striga hermonthica]
MATAEAFEAAVEDGLHLSKRVYFGKDRAVAPPKPPTVMERAAGLSFLPKSPMLYAVIIDPAVVDNPDMPSYQPHVHGRCDPPALIPLQMNGVSLEVDCFLDTAFVTLSGSWRVHCVMGSRSCDCRLAVPMGEQGSILGVDVELPTTIYSTQLVAMENEKGMEKITKTEDGGFLKSHIYTLKIPQASSHFIDGGTNVSVKLRWSQMLLYHDGELTLKIPFSFPEYVTPAAKKIAKREKIQLDVNAGPGTEVQFRTTSHPLKERQRQAGKLGFLYESEVLSWSNVDFLVTYNVSSSHIIGGVLLNPSMVHDVDRRNIFCCYLFPGKQQSIKVFRREVVFVVDISGSMKGKPLEDTKNALFSAVAKLDSKDFFNVIAFNGETYLFSSSMEEATAKAIENVTQWINMNFVAGGGTNILLPLNQAIKMLSDSSNSIPIVLLITDGAVEDERHICGTVKSLLTSQKNVSPRIYTLGIGTFCNHYFLRMLAMIGRGQHDVASDVDSIEVRIGGLFARASSIFLANIAFENLSNLDDLEVFPTQIPDLSTESPLIVSGRYRGTFPETLKVNGVLADMSNFSVDLKVEVAKEMPISKVVAKQQIELLTAEAWYSESEELIEKIAKISVQHDIVSEYMNMVLLKTQRGNTRANSTVAQEVHVPRNVNAHKKEDSKPERVLILGDMGLGFGNLTATHENVPPGSGDVKHPDAAEAFARAASNCCGSVCNHCCCMCCIQTCSRINDQCAIALTQLCGALACLGCFVCCGGHDGSEGVTPLNSSRDVRGAYVAAWQVWRGVRGAGVAV